MEIKSKVLSIKSKCETVCTKATKTPKVLNIAFVVFFSLMILLTLFGGVRVDIGSTVKGDGQSFTVRQSYFQVLAAGFGSIFMSDEALAEYSNNVNNRIAADFNVLHLSDSLDSNGRPQLEQLDQFARVAQDIQEAGYNPGRINWLLFRLAFARGMMHNYTLHAEATGTSVDMDLFGPSWSGNLAVAMAGQSIIMMFLRSVFLIVSLVMLGFAIFALVKNKPFKRVRLSFALLLIVTFAGFIFSFNFVRPDWVWILACVFMFIGIIGHTLFKHILMDKRDFSLSMFIHNGVFLLGGLLSFILLTGPLFRVTNAVGESVNYGINYLFDLAIAQSAYIALVPMSYVLVLVVTMLLLGLPFVLNLIFLTIVFDKFIMVDYRHNEKRIMLTIMLVVSLFALIVLGVVNLNMSDLLLNIRPLVAVFVIQPIVVAGMLVFEYLYKVKPVKKELVIT
ncbi:MAG: hypothetical protein FWD86_03480 [Firmicutes bacterium]|nr:hypothetical protein [Bacillota bacterium]